MKPTQITKLTGVSRQTLHNWKKNKPRLYEIVRLGCEFKRILQNGEAVLTALDKQYIELINSIAPTPDSLNRLTDIFNKSELCKKISDNTPATEKR